MDEEALFHLALTKPPHERAAFLAAACADEDLRHRVEQLLRAYDNPGSFLAGPAVEPRTASQADPGATTVETTDAGHAPAGEPEATIGPYRLVRKLGEGGMGSVWEAEQAAPIRRRVALKVIKPGMDSARVVARFEAERQALALMDHPNIARVFDAGATDAGRPFFVMELVEGVPITASCDELGLTVRERLNLFVRVCRAVQHAHQKGVIHRDLKPSNVLVVVQEGRPVPKVIDFGVAKALHARLGERTLHTEAGVVIGTLEYMAPEQADLAELDIDTRADVYALGVVLYELLTGTTPLTRARVRAARFDEVLRLIREEEAPRPSARLGESAGSLVELAARRRTDPARLVREVRGELDWIALRCLEKDRTRRYDTAAALAEDVERFLADEPVRACPPSTGYRVRKFLRRNRGPVAAAALVAVALVGGVVGTTWGLIESEAARGETGRALQQATEERRRTQDALREVTAARNQAQVVLATLTDEAVHTLLARRPTLGDDEKRFLRRVLELYQQAEQGGDDTEQGRLVRAAGRGQLATFRQQLGEDDQADREYRAARELLERLAADFPARPDYRERLARTRTNYGAFLKNVHRLPEALAEHTAAGDLFRGLVAEHPDRAFREGLADAHNNLAITLHELGRRPEAEAAFAAARDGYLRILADGQATPVVRADLAQCRNNLGRLYNLANRKADGETEAVAARDLLQALVNEFPAVRRYREDLALTRLNLGGLHGTTPGRMRDAEAEWTAARDLYARLAADFPAVPEYANGVGGAMVNLALIARHEKRYPAARQLLTDAAPFHRAALSASPQTAVYRVYFRNNRWALASVLVLSGDHAALPPVVEEFLAQATDTRADAVHAAGFLAAAIGLAAGDEALAPPKRAEAADRYAVLAVGYLGRAAEAGFRDAAAVEKDDRFAPLRGRPQFETWLGALRDRGSPTPPRPVK